MNTDRLSVDLRNAEKQIDTAYRSNLLFTLSRPQALWYLLSAYEEYFIREQDPNRNPVSVYEQTALADNLINQLKWPTRWIYADCPPGDSYSTEYSPTHYDQANSLLEIAFEYLSFESAFSYASWGLVDLTLDSTRITASPSLRADTRYDAYDRIAPGEYDPEIDYDFSKILEMIKNDVIVANDRFLYRVNKKLVIKALKYTGRTIERRFSLPPEWKLTEYSLGEYGLVIKTLWVLSAIHFCARVLAVWQGCVGLAYSQSLVSMSRPQLIHRVSRYTGLSSLCVSAITQDLTYGARNILHPDPPLQPLFEIVPDHICWPPNLILTSAMERNLLVLLNRLPAGRESYSRISKHRETLLQNHIIQEVKNDHFRYFTGRIPYWGPANDIDLAVISDSEKCCLILELKSFIGPADPRELKEKSKEIERGINQIQTRRQLACERPEHLFQKLEIDSSYEVFWGVASETSVGGAWVQNETVPVIRASQLVEKLNEIKALRKVCDWYMNHEYLPTPNSTYTEEAITARLAGYTIKWFGIRPI